MQLLLNHNDFYGYTSHFYNGDLFMEMDVSFDIWFDE